MKRILCLCLSLILVFGLIGCESKSTKTDGDKTTSKTSSVDSSSDSTDSTDSTDSSSSETTSSEKVEPVDDWRTHPQDFKLIALTYDDAPVHKEVGENSSTKIIDTISKYDGRATYFVIGRNLAKNGNKILKYALDKGFELGNHTYMHYSVSTHNIGKEWTADDNYDDFKKCQEIVKSETGFVMKYFRPSGGHINQALLEANSRLKMPMMQGNYYRGIRDYSQERTPENIYDDVMYNAFDGAIILLHSSNDRTAEATERFCRSLYNDGYRFCTVDELFKFKGIDPATLPIDKLIYGIDPVTGKILTKDS